MEKKLKLHERPVEAETVQPFFQTKQEAQVWPTLRPSEKGSWGNSMSLGLKHTQWNAGKLALRKIKSSDL